MHGWIARVQPQLLVSVRILIASASTRSTHFIVRHFLPFPFPFPSSCSSSPPPSVFLSMLTLSS